MESRSLIDAQFDRAVEIVQGLPKNGPIQTGYEDKLTMYSLYKQATVGNVKAPRPGMFDMLGRAKWDAWAQHKDLDSQEAKWLYVEALLKVLRKYSDKTVARDLVQELESYNGDASNLVMSASLSRSYSQSSGSTISEDHPSQRLPQPPLPVQPISPQDEDAKSSSSEETDDEPMDIRPQPPRSASRSQTGRPQSSLSGRAYRTPLASSFAMTSPPPRIPSTQPMPVFETPSAFFDQPAAVSPVYNRPGSSSFRPYAGSIPATPPQETPYPLRSVPAPPYNQVPRPALERALETVQAHVAALTERIETLEARSPQHISNSSSRRSNTPEQHLRDLRDRGLVRKWTMEDWGMWSIVLNPVSRCLEVIQQLTRFFATSGDRSPSLTVIRRLVLDISFLASVVFLIRMIWRRSGLRRKEVLAALVALWRAIAGIQPERSLADKNV